MSCKDVGAGNLGIRVGGVVFQRAGDDYIAAAELLEAPGVFIGLGEDESDLGEHLFDNRAKSPVAGEAPVAYSAVDDDDGDARLLSGLHEIGPDLQLHQQTKGRADISEGAADYPGEIEGEVKHAEVFSEQRVCPRKAGVGGCAYYDFIIGEFVPELLDYGCCCVDLAHADGVQPDALLFWVFAGDSAEALRPALAVAIVPDNPVKRNGNYGYGSQQI